MAAWCAQPLSRRFITNLRAIEPNIVKLAHLRQKPIKQLGGLFNTPRFMSANS